mgnify:FL=1
MQLKVVFSFILFLVLLSGYSQAPSFEGFIDYQVEVKSKSRFMSDETIKTFFGYGNTLRVYFKSGKYYRVSSMSEEFIGLKNKENYIKYKGRDTVYSIPDTSYHADKIQIKRNDKTVMIANYACKSIRFSTDNETTDYFYAPDLVQQPDDNPAIAGTEFHRFVTETKSVWLKCITDLELGVVTYTATRVQLQKVDDKLLQLPSLPVVAFNILNLIQPASPKSEKDWNAYLMRSINAELANKYLKIPKGEKSVKQTVQLEFVITRFGTIGEVTVLNAKDVHPALAKEAVRVIKEGYGWVPSTFIGQKIDGLARQPVTFMSSN